MENRLKKAIEEALSKKINNTYFVCIVITVLARRNDNSPPNWMKSVNLDENEYQRLLDVFRSYDDIDIKRMTLSPMADDILTILEIYEDKSTCAVIEDTYLLFILFDDLKRISLVQLDSSMSDKYSFYKNSNNWKNKELEEQEFRKILYAIKGYRFNYDILDTSKFSSLDLIELVNILKNIYSYSYAQQYEVIKKCKEVTSEKGIKDIFKILPKSDGAVKFMTDFYNRKTFRKIKETQTIDILKTIAIVAKDTRPVSERNSPLIKKTDYHISCGPFFSVILAQKNKGNTLVVNGNPFFNDLWNSKFSYEKTYFLCDSSENKEVKQSLEDNCATYITSDELQNHSNDICNIVILNPTDENQEIIKKTKEFIRGSEEKPIRLFVYEKQRTDKNKEPLYIIYRMYVNSLGIYPHNAPGRNGIHVIWTAELDDKPATISLIEFADMTHTVDSLGKKEPIGYIKGKPVNVTCDDILKKSNTLTQLLKRSGKEENSPKWKRNNNPNSFHFSKEITVKYTKSSPQIGQRGKSIHVQCWISLNLSLRKNENDTNSNMEIAEIDLKDKTYEKPTIKVFDKGKDDIEKGLPAKYLYSPRYKIQVAISDYITERMEYASVYEKKLLTFKTLVYILEPRIRADRVTIPSYIFEEIANNAILKDKTCAEISSNDIRLIKDEYAERNETNKKKSKLEETVLSALYLIFEQAKWEGYASENPLTEFSEEELENKEDLASLRKSFNRKNLSLSKIKIVYQNLKADAEKTPEGLALFMRLCLFGITPPILVSLTWGDIDTSYYETEGFVCVQICTILDSSSKCEALTNTREYRIVPCGKDLSEILIKRKRELEDKYHEELKSAYVLMFDKTELEEMKIPYSVDTLRNKSRKCTTHYFKSEDYSLSIPTTGNVNEDLNIAKLFGNIFRENFRLYAVRSGLTSDEINYLLGNKCQTTFGRHYWDPFNEISLLKINTKLERIFTAWRGES